MFKRVRRRIVKSEKEHKLGLTSEIKHDLNLNDTDSDSDESVSGSGSESSGSERPSRKRKRPLEGGEGESDAGERGNGSENQEEEDSESDAGGGDDETSAERGPTVGDALNNPLFYVSGDQQACVVCPSKLLKNQHMAELHTGATVGSTCNTLISGRRSDATCSTTYAGITGSRKRWSASRPGLMTSTLILRPTLCGSWTRLSRASLEPRLTSSPGCRSER